MILYLKIINKQKAIKYIRNLSLQLSLISAFFCSKSARVPDNLNGVETPVPFSTNAK